MAIGSGSVAVVAMPHLISVCLPAVGRFDPLLQQQRFDPLLTYVDQWVKERRTANYGTPIVVHEEARALAIATYEKALEGQRHEPRQQQQLF
jgi:hypothetical protein